MRGLVTFEGPLVTATTLLQLFGCEVVASEEVDGLAVVEVIAEGDAASLIAVAQAEEVLEFGIGDSLQDQQESGVYSPLKLCAAPERV
jgi:hypothetical protein